MTNLIWLHEDALSKSHPLFKTAPQDSVTFFVWDEEYFKKMNYSFKRLVFIFETLSEMNCEIYQGKTLEIISQLADENNANEVFVAETPNPLLQSVINDLEKKIKVRIIREKPFVNLKGEVNLNRFFSYWNKAKKLAIEEQNV